MLLVASCCNLVLALEYGVSSMKAGFAGIAAGKRLPEDLKGKNLTVNEEAVQKHARWARIQANQYENIWMGIILMYASALADCNKTFHLITCVVYVFLRTSFIYLYAYGINKPIPFRSLCFALGK